MKRWITALLLSISGISWGQAVLRQQTNSPADLESPSAAIVGTYSAIMATAPASLQCGDTGWATDQKEWYSWNCGTSVWSFIASNGASVSFGDLNLSGSVTIGGNLNIPNGVLRLYGNLLGEDSAEFIYLNNEMIELGGNVTVFGNASASSYSLGGVTITSWPSGGSSGTTGVGPVTWSTTSGTATTGLSANVTAPGTLTVNGAASVASLNASGSVSSAATIIGQAFSSGASLGVTKDVTVDAGIAATPVVLHIHSGLITGTTP